MDSLDVPGEFRRVVSVGGAPGRLFHPVVFVFDFSLVIISPLEKVVFEKTCATQILL